MTRAYYCDLCGERHEDPSVLKRIRTERFGENRSRSVSADICVPCRRLSIGELMDYFERRRDELERKL